MARKRQASSGADAPDRTDPTDPTDNRTDPTDRSDDPTDRTAADLDSTAQQFLAIVGSPLFAYALAAVLAVPAVLYLTAPLPSAPSAESVPEPPARRDTLARMAEPSRETLEPRARALKLLKRYEHALRDRDLNELRDYWQMTPQQEREMEELFRDARVVSPLVDLQQVEALGDDRMRIAFAQVLTLVRGAGQFYARGPTVFRADVVRAPGFDAWMLQNREEVPAQPAKPVARD